MAVGRVLVEPLRAGALAMYEFDGERTDVLVWGERGWEARRFGHRVLVDTALDQPLTYLVDRAFPERLAALPDVDGTLLVPMRACEAWDDFDHWDLENGERLVDRHGVLVLCGMAFVPDCPLGVELGGRDPVWFLEQAMLGFAGKEYDRSVPVISDFFVQHLAQRRARAAEEKAAEGRATALLEAMLDDVQLAEWRDRREFHVRGGDGFRYLVTHRGQHNVFRVEGGVRTVEYCLVTKGWVPIPDLMLMQKLLLEADPAGFHRETNAWLLGEGSRQVIDPVTFEVRAARQTLPRPVNVFADVLLGGVVPQA